LLGIEIGEAAAIGLAPDPNPPHRYDIDRPSQREAQPLTPAFADPTDGKAFHRRILGITIGLGAIANDTMPG
jgi:hypothetical protein